MSFEFEDATPERGFIKCLLYGCSGAGKCVANAYILTNNGLGLIDNIGKNKKEGLTEYIESLSLSEGKGVQTSHFWKEKVQQTFTVISKHGYELEGTAQHPILTWTPECTFKFKWLSELTKDDVVVIARGTNKFALKPFEFSTQVLLQKNKKGGKRKVINFPKVITKDIALLLGYFVADGNFTNNILSFANSKKWFKENIFKCAKSLNLVPSINSSGWTLNSRNLGDIFFRIFGKPEKFTARNKRIPDCILQSPKEIQISFLKGLFDCDSSYDVNKKYLEYSTASKQLHDQVKVMLLNLGMISSTSTRKNVKVGDKVYDHTYYRLTLSGIEVDLYSKLIGSDKYQFSKEVSIRRNSNIDAIPFLKDKLRKDISKWKKDLGWESNGMINHRLKRFPSFQILFTKSAFTYQSLKRAIDTFSPLGVNLSFYNELLTSGFYFDQVKEVVQKKKEVMVYDVHIPETHAFWSNGYISHNTLTSLKFATAIGRTLIIDTENKSGHYAPVPSKPRKGDLPGFKTYRTKSVTDVIGILKQLKKSKEFKCIIIDSGTQIWDSCTTTFMRDEKMKNSNMYSTYVTKGKVEYGGWNGIKKYWKELETLILDIDAHVFMTARLKIILDQDTFVKIAEEPAIEKWSPYSFSTLIKMERGMVNGNVDCYVENDTNWCLGGVHMKNPDITLWRKVLDRLNVTTHIPLPVEVEEEDSSTNINNQQKEEIKSKVIMIEDSQKIVLKRQMKKTDYGYEDWESKIDNLTKSQANALIQQLIGKNYSFFQQKN